MDFAARYLAILNSSINFFIYCLVGTQFRSTLLDILRVKKNLPVPDIQVDRIESTRVTNKISPEHSTEKPSIQLHISHMRIKKKRFSNSNLSHSSLDVSCTTLATTLAVEDSHMEDSHMEDSNM